MSTVIKPAGDIKQGDEDQQDRIMKGLIPSI